jgi:hypothetical protein
MGGPSGRGFPAVAEDRREISCRSCISRTRPRRRKQWYASCMRRLAQVLARIPQNMHRLVFSAVVSAFVVVAFVFVVLLSTTPSGALGTQGDDAATRAYVAAVYKWTVSAVDRLPVSDRFFVSLAGRVGRECPGVFSGAPSLTLTSRTLRPQVPRQVSGLTRTIKQVSDLKAELSLALLSAWSRPDRQADLALARAVLPLRWENPALTRSVRIFIVTLQETSQIDSSRVCADMKAWVASGYRALPVGTRHSLRLREAMIMQADRAEPIQQLLVHYENSRDRILINETNRLIRRHVDLLMADQKTYQLLLQTLGLPGSRPEGTNQTEATGGEIPFEL